MEELSPEEKKDIKWDILSPEEKRNIEWKKLSPEEQKQQLLQEVLRLDGEIRLMLRLLGEEKS